MRKTETLRLATFFILSGAIASLSFGAPTTMPTAPAADPTATTGPAEEVPGDNNYDPQARMVWGKVSNNGYHTQMKPGSPAHPTRIAFGYALSNLKNGSPERIKRAEEVLAVALSLQVTDPTRAEFGIWPWLWEEPVEQMAPPDWNWADFCGSQLAEILAKHGDKLSPGMRDKVRQGFSNAAWCIFRRNVQPNYTNIAIMGAGVTAAAGEILNEPLLTQYARQRLTNCVKAFETEGGFNEYNSPSYTTIVITECDRILNLVKDPQTRAAADKLRYYAWKTVSESFHPATGQWAGPHSRSYQDLLGVGWANFFATQTGAPIKPHPKATSGGPSKEVDYSDCPEEFKARFKAMPSDSVEVRRRFILRGDDARSTYGTTWLSNTACLGTVNFDSFWIQRRPVIGYWKTAEDPAVVLKMRFLRDEKDFASGAVRTTQKNADAVSLITLLTDKGDHHDTLDKPKDGYFHASTFRVRYELNGVGVHVMPVKDGGKESVFDLIAGDTSARITVGPGQFDNAPIKAVAGRENDSAWVDVFFYDGESKAFKFADLANAWAVIGTHIQTGPQPATTPISVADDSDGKVRATFGELKVEGSRKPGPY